MRKRLHKILVTGGAGFIGSAFARLLIKRGQTPFILDKLTYAGDLKRLGNQGLSPKGTVPEFRFYKTDICDKSGVRNIFRTVRPDIVVHFAAETHVDRSIKDASPFIETNIKGTQVILDACREFKAKKFIFISTDEVYGEIPDGKFSERSPIRPNSPYAASKAAADLLTQAYIRTYNIPAIIVRPCNNYGPWQYPEKLIPVAIASVLKGGKVPVYAKGENVREWLYVEDCARGVLQAVQRGKTGQIYNLGSGIESRNIDTVRLILKNLGVGSDRFKFVKDRPGHDFRYSLDSSKARKVFGCRPRVSLSEGIKLTVAWHLGDAPQGDTLGKLSVKNKRKLREKQ